MAGVTHDPTDPRLARGIDTDEVPQAEVYLVLSDEERAKGFVRPVRTAYVHRFWKDWRDEPLPDVITPENRGELGGCGALTTMGLAIAETYARDPKFYGGTYCTGCSKHLPIEEFRWDADGTVVGS